MTSTQLNNETIQ